MVEENDYTDILQILAYVDPIFERWTRLHAGPFSIEKHEELRNGLADFLMMQRSSLDQTLQFIY